MKRLAVIMALALACHPAMAAAPSVDSVSAAIKAKRWSDARVELSGLLRTGCSAPGYYLLSVVEANERNRQATAVAALKAMECQPKLAAHLHADAERLRAWAVADRPVLTTKKKATSSMSDETGARSKNLAKRRRPSSKPSEPADLLSQVVGSDPCDLGGRGDSEALNRCVEALYGPKDDPPPVVALP